MNSVTAFHDSGQSMCVGPNRGKFLLSYLTDLDLKLGDICGWNGVGKGRVVGKESKKEAGARDHGGSCKLAGM